jgi:hypothetical protein
MTVFIICEDCGRDVNRHDNDHDCPGPPLRRAEVAEMIQEALADVAERLRSRAVQMQQTMPAAASALLLVANELMPACERMVDGATGEVVFGEGVVDPGAGEQRAGGGE